MRNLIALLSIGVGVVFMGCIIDQSSDKPKQVPVASVPATKPAIIEKKPEPPKITATVEKPIRVSGRDYGADQMYLVMEKTSLQYRYKPMVTLHLKPRDGIRCADGDVRGKYRYDCSGVPTFRVVHHVKTGLFRSGCDGFHFTQGIVDMTADSGPEIRIPLSENQINALEKGIKAKQRVRNGKMHVNWGDGWILVGPKTEKALLKVIKAYRTHSNAGV